MVVHKVNRVKKDDDHNYTYCNFKKNCTGNSIDRCVFNRRIGIDTKRCLSTSHKVCATKIIWFYYIFKQTVVEKRTPVFSYIKKNEQEMNKCYKLLHCF